MQNGGDGDTSGEDSDDGGNHMGNGHTAALNNETQGGTGIPGLSELDGVTEQELDIMLQRALAQVTLLVLREGGLSIGAKVRTALPSFEPFFRSLHA